MSQITPSSQRHKDAPICGVFGLLGGRSLLQGSVPRQSTNFRRVTVAIPAALVWHLFFWTPEQNPELPRINSQEAGRNE